MERIVKPTKAVSFEEALRNLASRLTGTLVAELPRTQEAIVQYMADNIKLPKASAQDASGLDMDKVCEAVTQEVMARLKLDELGEAVTKEVLARITESMGANLAVKEPSEAAQDGVEAAGGTYLPLPPLKRPRTAPRHPQRPLLKAGAGASPPRRKPNINRKDD